MAGYVDFRQDVGKWLTFNAGLRVDHHSRVGTEWVPQAGLAFHLPHTIELKASASKGFRYPILREMYMFPPQNPDLKPESMWNYEIAFSQRLLGGSLSYGINLFYIDGKNLIMTLSNPSGSGMLNQNSGEIDNAGVEAQVAYRFNKSWSVDANYSYLHMENSVIAAPEHKLYAGANFTQGAGRYRRAYSTSPDFTPHRSGYNRESCLMESARTIPCRPMARHLARGENLLAQRYEINAGYPMPRATVMAGINLNF